MPEGIDTKNHPAVKALAEHQERLGLTNSEMAKRYLRCSDATWSTLKSGTYPANPEPWIAKCDAALHAVEENLAAQPGNKRALVELSDQKAVLAAVRDCANEERNRLVVFLADTGGGKSALARRLREKYLDLAVVLEATEVWRRNYRSALINLSAAIGVGVEQDSASDREIEDNLLQALGASPRLVVIDEGHYLGKEALNLLKLVLNRSASRIVICAMPQLWTNMARAAWQEARQLRNRTFAKIVQSPEAGISNEDARKFLSQRMAGFSSLEKETSKVVAACVASANAFGLYNTLQGICDELRTESTSCSLELVQAAIRRVEALRS